MWAHAFELAMALALAASVRALCQTLLGRATLRVLDNLASKALAEATNRDHVAEVFGVLIAGVPAQQSGRRRPSSASGIDHHTYTSVEPRSDSAAGSIPRRG